MAEAELDRLKARGIDTITPVLICAGAEGRKIQRFFGPMEAGKTRLMTVSGRAEETDVSEEESKIDGKTEERPDPGQRVGGASRGHPAGQNCRWISICSRSWGRC